MKMVLCMLVRGNKTCKNIILTSDGYAHNNTLNIIYMNDITNPEELWTIQKGKLRLLFTHLHDEDFRYDYGKKDVMLELLQKKLGKSREELNALLLGL
jgi:hypothetical protein